MALRFRQLLDRQTALGSDFGRRIAVFQSIERCPHDVVRVCGAVTLGEDVGYADDVEHRAHRSAGDDAGALRGGLHEYPGRAMPPLHRMVQGSALQAHLDHPPPRLLHRLLHRDRHFLGFSLAHADATIAVADHRQRGERKNPSTLHDLGDAVDADHLLAQAVAAIVLLLPAALLPAHRLCHSRSCSLLEALELQAALTGGLGQRLHAAVILESRPVERDRVDAQRFRLLGDTFADDRCRRLVAAVLEVLPDVALDGGCAGENTVAFRRDDLRVDVAIRPADHQPGRTLLGDAQARLARAAYAGVFLVHGLISPAYFFLVSLITT